MTNREYRAELAILDATIERLQSQRKAVFQAMSDAAYADFKANTEKHYSEYQVSKRTAEQRTKAGFATKNYLSRQKEKIEMLERELAKMKGE